MQAKPSPRSNDSKLCGVCVTIKPWSMWKNIIYILCVMGEEKPQPKAGAV